MFHHLALLLVLCGCAGARRPPAPPEPAPTPVYLGMMTEDRLLFSVHPWSNTTLGPPLTDPNPPLVAALAGQPVHTLNDRGESASNHLNHHFDTAWGIATPIAELTRSPSGAALVWTGSATVSARPLDPVSPTPAQSELVRARIEAEYADFQDVWGNRCPTLTWQHAGSVQIRDQDNLTLHTMTAHCPSEMEGVPPKSSVVLLDSTQPGRAAVLDTALVCTSGGEACAVEVALVAQVDGVDLLGLAVSCDSEMPALGHLLPLSKVTAALK